jgi:hypothetical protein
MKLLSLFVAAIALIVLPGCFSITRTEKDIYTITDRDTTIRKDVNNAPEQRDNGTIYPSPGTVDIQRTYVQRDSTVMRYYPAFLRLGGIEAASFFTTGFSSNGTGNGIFGLYDLLSGKHTKDTKIFGANMYRLGPYEVRLRWLNDAPNWTVGTAAAELFVQHRDSSIELAPGEYLIGFFPGYIRKRFFLREEIPYVMVVPFFGLGLFPSQYVNFGATLDVGSYGGFNLRGYLGYIAGSSSLFREPTRRRFGQVITDDRDYSAAFPYFGIGISALDFVNKTEELFIEWKDHKHSALEVSGLNIDLVRSLSSNAQSFFTTISSNNTPSASTPALTGLIVRLASATYPLPFGERRFWVGTSLANLVALSGTEVGLGILPIRAGYRFNVLYDELNLEPFAELTYYPQSILHIGARLSIPAYDFMMLNVVAGYASGSSNSDVAFGLDGLGVSQSWSAAYIGVGIGIGDVFHTPKEVMRK